MHHFHNELYATKPGLAEKCPNLGLIDKWLAT
jgi:hypothetical protein